MSGDVVEKETKPAYRGGGGGGGGWCRWMRQTNFWQTVFVSHMGKKTDL